MKNLSSHQAAQSITRDQRGQTIVVVAVKASFTWDHRGALAPCLPVPLVTADAFGGDAATGGLLLAAELGPPKPAVDVLLAGWLELPAPVDTVEVTLEVGRRVKKTVEIAGTRTWQRVPIDWAVFSGGCDPTEVNRRGFGPLAAHWQPRVARAGTYDDRWRAERSPLPPEDLNARFFNTAPDDQQLPSYLPGEEVRLVYMGRVLKDRFVLPPFQVPVTFVTAKALLDAEARVDTIVIEPGARRVSLIARAAFVPRPNVVAFREAIVGTLSRGRRRALESGKVYRQSAPPIVREPG